MHAPLGPIEYRPTETLHLLRLLFNLLKEYINKDRNFGVDF